MASTLDKITDIRNAARPNSARVTSGRSAGGATLACDSLTGWPTASKVHFVTYQVDSSSDVVAGTQLDCYGIVSGNNIGSFTVVDGTDTGHAVGDYVEMLPTAAWGQDLADALMVEHSRTGTHTAITGTTANFTGAVSTDTVSEHTAGAGVTVDGVKLKDNKVATDSAVDYISVSAGMVVQVVNTTSSAVNTGTTTIPADDTIPQITEGTEFLTLAITPKSTTNILVIEITATMAVGTASKHIIGAFFQDAALNSLAAGDAFVTSADGLVTFVLRHTMAAGTTSATTFRFRAGPNSAATVTFNGQAGSRLFGAIPKSVMTITEYKS